MGVIDVIAVVVGVAVVHATAVLSASGQPLLPWRRANQPGAHEMIRTPSRRTSRRR